MLRINIEAFNFSLFYRKFKTFSLFLVSLLIFLVMLTENIYAQNLKDSIKIKTHSPHKATMYSLVLPGLGQVYNRQYWKVPVLYAGIATIVYFVSFNSDRYHTYRDEYVARLNNDTLGLNKKFELYSDNTVLLLKNYYQRNLEFTYIMAGVVYLLNLIDASVYAHLFSFDVGNDLSLKIEPMINNNAFSFGSQPTAGLKLSFKF